MSVAGIFSSLGNNASAISNQNYQLQQLGRDLASGNLSAAQSDFATIQQAFTQAATVSSSTSSNPVAQAFQQLSTDLKSGDLLAAQKDYSTLQQDLQSLSRHLHIHNRMKPGGTVQDPVLQDVPGQDLSSTSLQSASLSVAQQAYATLQQAVDTGIANGTNTIPRHVPLPPVYSSAVSFLA